MGANAECFDQSTRILQRSLTQLLEIAKLSMPTEMLSTYRGVVGKKAQRCEAIAQWVSKWNTEKGVDKQGYGQADMN